MRKEMQEWKGMRFGMFIHWGLYAFMGKGEWVMYNQPVDKDDYRKLMNSFTAEQFDAGKWASAAKAAGMKYMVLTTRHHDGFSLWDSAASHEQFTSMHTPARRDFVREYVEACRDAGLKVGLYYSPMDWRFPGYFFPQMYRKSAMKMRKQCYEQVHELLTQYGKIDIFWFDGGEDYWLCHGRNLHKDNSGEDFRLHPQCPGFWGAEELNSMIRSLQPGIIVNNRFGMREFGDFLTPENEIGSFNTETPWETNNTLNGSWGWVPGRAPLSLRRCIHLLVRCATGDGNLLLNIGPKPDGSIEPDQLERLNEIGSWLSRYGESIYETTGGPLINTATGGMTFRDNIIYVHILDWPENRIILPELNADILEVSSPTSQTLHYELRDAKLHLSVDAEERQCIDTIVKLRLDRPASQLRSGQDWYLHGPQVYTSEALIVDKQ